MANVWLLATVHEVEHGLLLQQKRGAASYRPSWVANVNSIGEIDRK